MPTRNRSILLVLAVGAAALIAPLAAPRARADLDARLERGDKVTGVLDPRTETETFRFVCPSGAKITVKAKCAKGGSLVLGLAGPGDAQQGAGRAVKLTRTAAGSGEHVLTVASPIDGSPLAYSLSVTWKAQARFTASATVEAGGSFEVPFTSDAGATADCTVRPGRGSAAVPVVRTLLPAGDVPVPVGDGPKARATLATTGDHVFVVGDGPETSPGTAGGALSATVVVRARKVKPRKLDLRAAALQEGVDDVVAASAGPAGGGVSADPLGSLDGAAVNVPPGSLGFPTTLLLGSAPDVVPVGTDLFVAVGPAVFFGPEGLSFAAGTPVTITLPFDPAKVDDPLRIRVYRRDADGTVVEITGFTTNLAAGTVSFPSSHFSVYQVFVRLPITVQRLAAGDGLILEGYGAVTAVDGDTLAVGARSRQVGAANNAGNVFVYARSGGVWAEQQVLASPSPVQFGLFGLRVAVDDAQDLLVVGATGESSAAFRDGVAHVFRRDAGVWSHEQALAQTTAINLSGFGSAVAVSGDTIAVGAPFRQRSTNDFGAVFVYRFDGSLWNLEQRIDAVTAPHPFGSFGDAIALQGNRLVVGDTTGGAGRPGQAYVYERTGVTWSLVATLDDPEPVAENTFGDAVALDGDLVVVGDDGGTHQSAANVGKAVVFFRDAGGTWTEDRVFGGTVAAAGVGAGVGLGGGLVAITTQAQDMSTAGRLEVYERISPGLWTLRLRRQALAAAGPQGYGVWLSMSGRKVAVGAVDEIDQVDPGVVETLDLTNL